jgi:hypothetical protein
MSYVITGYFRNMAITPKSGFKEYTYCVAVISIVVVF